MTKAEKFFKDIRYKKIAFIGSGVSHNDLIKLFLQKGIDVTLCDKRTKEQFDSDFIEELVENGAQLSLGEDYLEGIYSCDIIFRTPGMYYNHPAIQKARNMGIVVTSEMEVFFDLCPCRIVAVTGSDGKTTTTTLISEFYREERRRVYKGGNIGKALLPVIEKITEHDIAVVELSSFQLLSMRKSPDVAVITNISPNHLDVHGTMEEYIYSKTNIIAHQNAFSKTVLNADNEQTINLRHLVRGNLVTFSRQSKVRRGAFLDNGMLCYSDDGIITEIVSASAIKIPGIHNVENYLTAIAATWGDVRLENIVKVAQNFGGVEHRIEFVREIKGVKYYNDSIATSPTRVLAGLNSFDQKLIVIAGGYDKKIPFEPLADAVNEKVKILILMGDTAKKIEEAITSSDSYNPKELKILKAKSLEDAVKIAKSHAKEGDIVTLSPACASFDKYRNFEERGNHFKNIINSI